MKANTLLECLQLNNLSTLMCNERIRAANNEQQLFFKNFNLEDQREKCIRTETASSRIKDPGLS